ncbi:MAG: hypothetical protein Nkreftii_003210 [Candidatus Nitrospira kreftii]|uniref:Uncharacterized protein n=1 Tax=Candidatus Nitrospira kreftii TaxID=2652173 RepID=A0A7S8FGS2_9BACT|nr:MAG: hypothetical protein Nkreftii_003210 [Candidatus Nitrospira kreftii]
MITDHPVRYSRVCILDQGTVRAGAMKEGGAKKKAVVIDVPSLPYLRLDSECMNIRMDWKEGQWISRCHAIRARVKWRSAD